MLLSKVIPSAADEFAKLVKDAAIEVSRKTFHETFYSSAQDQSAKNISKEINAETYTCDTHQVGKVGSSVVGELARSGSNFVTTLYR